MKLAVTIESEFKKILLIGLTISTLTIFIFSVFLAKETVTSATNFIESHISALTTSEINFQNVSELDRNVRQLHSSWKESQGIELRIAVYIDDNMVAQAGQLQKFGLFSFSSKKIIQLPSSHNVLLSVDVDLSHLLSFVLATTGFVCVFLLLCFWQLRKRMRKYLLQVSKPLEDRITWLKDVSNSLPESLGLESKTQVSNIEELSNLDQSFETFIKRLRMLEAKIAEKSFSEGRVKMAEQVAHSLKGAIGTLELLLKNNPNLPPQVDTEIRLSIAKMINVSAGILDLKKAEGHLLLSVSDENFSPVDIIESVVQQKQIFYPQMKIKITEINSINDFIFGPKVDFETMISDLIDNAYDATNGNGFTEIAIESSKSTMHLTIKDNGCGINPEVIPHLMREGVTFKASGNGLGLFHAKNTIKAMSGEIQIDSKVGIGTEVKIRIPKAENISLEIVAGQKVILIDDDELIHKMWDQILSNHLNKINFIHLYSKNEFENWLEMNGVGSFGERFYIFDYDLKSDLTGIDLIEKHSLRLESIVISGMADDPEVARQAKKVKVKLLNKSNIHRIKIKLIEDEETQPHVAVYL